MEHFQAHADAAATYEAIATTYDDYGKLDNIDNIDDEERIDLTKLKSIYCAGCRLIKNPKLRALCEPRCAAPAVPGKLDITDNSNRIDLTKLKPIYCAGCRLIKNPKLKALCEPRCAE